MPGIVKSIEHGGLPYCAHELGWDPKTMRKGGQELKSGIDLPDTASNQGRKRVEE